MLGFDASARLLSRYGIPTVRSLLIPGDGADRARLAAETVCAARAIFGGQGDRPEHVVLKLLAQGFSHKSDAGFVALGLESPEAVETSSLRMLSRLSPECRVEGFLLQPMVKGGREAILGASVDPQFGPVVAFGPGGILVELLGGLDFLRPPFDMTEAMHFLGRNRFYPVLSGIRGAGPADLESIASAMVALGTLMIENAGSIRSVDLNPFMVMDRGKGSLALDVRIEEDGV